MSATPQPIQGHELLGALPEDIKITEIHEHSNSVIVCTNKGPYIKRAGYSEFYPLYGLDS